jgi:hypothetical protein
MRKITCVISIILLAGFVCGCTRDKTTVPDIFVCNNAVTYTNVVKPIIDSNCASLGCHSGPNSSGIMLDSYLGVKMSFSQGDAFCTVEHDSACKAMPYPIGTPKLNDTQIARLRCWANYGFIY